VSTGKYVSTFWSSVMFSCLETGGLQTLRRRLVAPFVMVRLLELADEGADFHRNFQNWEGETNIVRNIGTCCAVGYTAGWAWCDTCCLLVSYCCGAALSMRKEPAGSFLMLNACATIPEPLDPFVDHPLWHDTVHILHWYPSMHFGTWYTFSP
jgi:hypothetical protein